MTVANSEFLTVCIGILILGITVAILIRAIAPKGFFKGKK